MTYSLLRRLVRLEAAVKPCESDPAVFYGGPRIWLSCHDAECSSWTCTHVDGTRHTGTGEPCQPRQTGGGIPWCDRPARDGERPPDDAIAIG